MKSVFKIISGALAMVAMVVTASAHHSGAGFGTEVKEITGVVKEFQFKNPHSWIQLDVTDANGKVTEWSVEWGSPYQLGRDGYRPSTFPAGAKVTMKVRPMISGAPVAGFVGAKMADGKTVGRWDRD